MKKLMLIGIIVLSGCGYSSRNNELIGQAKKLVNQTPIMCSDRVDADISLGVMRNGVGSVSKEDVWLTVERESDQKILAEAASKGLLVKVTYDVKRWVWCYENHIVTKAEITN